MIDQNELPKGWEVKKLGEVCETTSGGTPSRRDPNFYNGHIPWVKSGELDKGLITDTEEKITEAAIKNSSAKVFPKGTLLIALYGATIGKLAFLGVEAATNQAVCGIFENKIIDSKYLYQFLFFSKAALVKQGIGGAQPNISQGILKNLEIPLPPLPEQHRIVTKIEELFSQLDNGIAQLKTARAQLKVYRQAVLKWAAEGRLTNAEVQEGELPEGWKMEKLSNVCKFSQGIQVPIGDQKIEQFPGSVRFLRIIDFTQGDDPPRYIENPGEKYLLRKDEIAMVRYGTVGFVCTGKEGVIANNLFKIVPIDLLTKKYLIHFLQSHLFLRRLETKGATMQALSFGLINPIPMPLPPLSEQHRIVQEIESRLSVCDKLEETIGQGLQQAEALRQSILKRAFEGKLVT